MALSSKQRSAINRQNASKSSGPKTDAGKAQSRKNALKHGLRADTLALPNEDPTVVAARNESWNDYYKPQSPAAQHLVNQCIQATLLADRCNAFHHAALSKQIREVQMLRDRQEREDLEALTELLETDPARAIRHLTRMGVGLRYLIERWESLSQSLEDRRGWIPDDRDEAIRLQGFCHEFHTLKDAPVAWLTRLYCIICEKSLAQDPIEPMFADEVHPAMFHDLCTLNSLPEASTCFAWLRDIVADHLYTLRTLETEMRTRFEDPDRAALASRSLILQDPSEARLFLRYHAEARTSFHRAYRELIKTLELDALSSPDDLPIVAEPPPAPPPNAVSPNEPKSVATRPAETSSERAERLLKAFPSPADYIDPDGELAAMAAELGPGPFDED